MGRYVLTKSPDGQFHFRLQAANGERILSSQMYATKVGAQVGIASVGVSAAIDSRYERKTATDGQYMFNLRGGNGERIGTSETYTSVSAREAGITSCKVNAPGATIEDRT